MANRYDLIVFDWYGTLMNSELRIVTCMQRAAEDVGLPLPEHAAASDVIGLGLDDALARLFPDADEKALDAVVAAYRRHWLGNEVESATMFEGAVEVVERLHASGHLLAVATGKSRRGLDVALAQSGLDAFFHATRCADETFSKPHPQMLEEILTDLDTAPERAIVIGDTEYDMQMAANAGVAAIGVAHGVHNPDRLLANGALFCFANLFELSEWLHDLR